MDTCVAYFSKTGNIEIIAKYLAKKIGAKAIKLDDKTNYKGVIGFIKGGFGASTAKKAKMDKAICEQISKYDRIVLATPVWAGKTTPAINSVLDNVNFEGKKVYVVTTQADPGHGGADERKAFYTQAIEERKGKLIDCFALSGTSPTQKHRSKEDLEGQVDAAVIIK